MQEKINSFDIMVKNDLIVLHHVFNIKFLKYLHKLMFDKLF